MEWGSLLSSSIVIDEEAFDKASNQLSELAQDIQNLRNEIENLLNELQHGFDTPAGHKFITSCKGNLLDPMDKQKIVVDHISENLKKARATYSSVFEGYRQLNNTIKEN